jgi:hypothetical protein
MDKTLLLCVVSSFLDEEYSIWSVQDIRGSLCGLGWTIVKATLLIKKVKK